jgi:hypothetical protein
METTARINSSMLTKYLNKPVLLVGKVLGLQGNKAILESTDKGQVVVHLSMVNTIIWLRE